MYNFKYIRIKYTHLLIISMIYYYIPCVLFVLTWTKWWIALLVTSGILISLMMLLKRKASLRYEDNLDIKISVIIFTIIFCLAIGFYAGWAGFGYQTEDWPKHNAVIRDLLEKSWPVIYTANGENALLTYYIGQYLFPACIGKILNLSFENVLIINWLWSSIGLMLVCFLFMYVVKAKKCRNQILCLLFILLAGGLMTLQQGIGSVLYPQDISIGEAGWKDYFLTYGKYMLQYRTNFILLRWAYAQTIVSWIISLLFVVESENIEIYVPLLIPSVLFGTFSALSLVIMALIFWGGYCIKEKKFSNIVKKTLSHENVISLLTLGMVLFVYYFGYLTQAKPNENGFKVINFFAENFGIYLLFVLGSFGIHCLIIMKEFRNSLIFWSITIVMLILPFFKFGVANDLLMGACIAPSMILNAFIFKWFISVKEESVNFRKGIMITLLLIGTIKPILEINSLRQYDFSVFSPADNFVSLEYFADRKNPDIALDVKYNYFTYDAQDSIFMKMLGQQ